jgi:hypothetical protein
MIPNFSCEYKLYYKVGFRVQLEATFTGCGQVGSARLPPGTGTKPPFELGLAFCPPSRLSFPEITGRPSDSELAQT